MSAFRRGRAARRIAFLGLCSALAILGVSGSERAGLAAPAAKQKEQKATAQPILPGGDSKEPINIEAGKLDYFDKEQKLVYTGNVVAVQGESTLKTATLIIFLTPKQSGDAAGAPSSSSQVQRMEAPGRVTITSKDQIGTGDSGLYLKSDNKVYINGNVTLTQGENVTKGDKLVYDLNTKQSVVTGRVRSMFLPNKSDDSDHKKTEKAQ